MAGAWSFDSKQEEDRADSLYQSGIAAAAGNSDSLFNFSANCEPPNPDSPLFSYLANQAAKYGGVRDRPPRKQDRSFPCFGSGERNPFGNLKDNRVLAAMWPDLADISPNSLSKADATFAARIASAAAEVAAAEAAQATRAAAAYAAVARPEDVAADVDVHINYECEIENQAEKARKALEYYKDTEGEEFEFVEIQNSETILRPPYIIYHLTFMAKRCDSCPQLFFAELYERWHPDDEFVVVKMCMILDPSAQDVRKGCGHVPSCGYFVDDKIMLHPKGVEFCAGPPGGTPEWDKDS